MSDLFRAMEAFCRRPQEGGGPEVFHGLLLDQGDRLAAELAAEGAPLWRWSGGAPFDEARWRETLSVGWRKKGSFPTLYKEPGVYDKREVAACFLLTAGVTLSDGVYWRGGSHSRWADRRTSVSPGAAMDRLWKCGSRQRAGPNPSG